MCKRAAGEDGRDGPKDIIGRCLVAEPMQEAICLVKLYSRKLHALTMTTPWLARHAKASAYRVYVKDAGDAGYGRVPAVDEAILCDVVWPEHDVVHVRAGESGSDRVRTESTAAGAGQRKSRWWRREQFT